MLGCRHSRSKIRNPKRYTLNPVGPTAHLKPRLPAGLSVTASRLIRGNFCQAVAAVGFKLNARFSQLLGEIFGNDLEGIGLHDDGFERLAVNSRLDSTP